MSDTPVPAGLADWMAGVERQLRDLATGNPLDRGSVTDAAGNAVPLSSLAFGQVADIWSGVGVVDAAAQPGQTSTDPGTGVTPWTYMDPHPVVTVLVRGGRLRVDWSAQMAFAGGSTAANPSLVYSYRVLYTGPPDKPGSVSVQVIDPDYYRGLVLRDPSFSGNYFYLQAGNWAMHTGLAPGWYRVQGAWRMTYAASQVGPHGYIDNPRIAATPF